MNLDRMEAIVLKALADPAYRVSLAKAMIQPLRTTRDYSLPCDECGQYSVYDSGVLVRAGGADFGCHECIVRVVLDP